MGDIELFINYASEDHAHAKRLFDAVSTMPEIEIWMDKETLLPGDTWEEGIWAAIERCRFFIVLMSATWEKKDTLPS